MTALQNHARNSHYQSSSCNNTNGPHKKHSSTCYSQTSLYIIPEIKSFASTSHESTPSLHFLPCLLFPSWILAAHRPFWSKFPTFFRIPIVNDHNHFIYAFPEFEGPFVIQKFFNWSSFLHQAAHKNGPVGQEGHVFFL